MSERGIPVRSLREKLRSGDVCLGVFCELPCREVIEIIGLAGWDFAVIDCEHAPISDAMLPDLIRAATCVNLPVLVRVADNTASSIQHALDAGAAGIQVPQISSVEAARQAVAAARFQPVGSRGFNPFVRAAGYYSKPIPEFLEQSNEILLVLQIESAEGLQAVDGILDLPGIDVLFVGPYDLSQSLGIPGEVSHPKVFAAGAELLRKARDRGMEVGAFTASEQNAREWMKMGAKYICYSVDSVFLLQALKSGQALLRA